MRSWISLAAALATTGFAASAVAEAPDVIVSVKPLHGLTAAIMEGVGEPRLLLDGTASPHGYSLRPSDARALSEADLVIWVGPTMEAFLTEPLETLAENAEIITASRVEGMRLLAGREGGFWEHDDHDHDEHAEQHHDEHAEERHDQHAEEQHDEHDEEQHDDHAEADHEERHLDEAAIDGHLWLNPHNAALFAKATAAALSTQDPANAARYEANLTTLLGELEDLDQRLETALNPLKDRPFIVFHDAYQYFEDRYGLAAAGSVTVSPERQPGARRISELRAAIEERGALCVFAEPQFSPAMLDVLAEGTEVGYGILDPLGASVDKGPEAYQEILGRLGDSVIECLTLAG